LAQTLIHVFSEQQKLISQMYLGGKNPPGASGRVSFYSSIKSMYFLVGLAAVHACDGYVWLATFKKNMGVLSSLLHSTLLLLLSPLHTHNYVA